ncbi:hypothetical protein [Marinobacter sp.]|uniref:hypothetical protein n=1 Tax=Marinobacter sp. TaxID=50741 RepID=UPI00384A5104
MKIIAVSEKASFWRLRDINASLLAFDKIYIPQGKSEMDRSTLQLDLHTKRVSIEDVEYLESKGVVVQNPLTDESSEIVENALANIRRYNAKAGGISEDTKLVFGNMLERMFIKKLSVGSEETFVPASTLSRCLPSQGVHKKESNFFSILIENLPVLSDEVPFDEVLSFKEEYAKEYRRLMYWATGNALTDGVNAGKEQLSEMIEGFRRHEELGRLRFKPGKIEILCQGLGAFGDVFTLRFGRAAKTLATIRKTKADLLEHEANNPHLPLSYIIKSQDEFR